MTVPVRMLSPTKLALLATVLLMCMGSARSDEIMDWNMRGDALAAEAQMAPVQHGRVNAILHVAMFEAVNAIDRRYAPYKLSLTADRDASKLAAAAAAGFTVLSTLFPNKKAELEAAYQTTLAGIADANAKTKGIAVGQQAAQQMIALRADDGANAPERYRPATSPGVYVPTVVPAFTTAPNIKPWVMTSGSQFRPAAPPALTSETWTNDLNEIRMVGGRTSTTRTADQTTAGRFWFLTGPRTFNPLVRQVAQSKEMDLVDCARTFALTAMAASDALIAVFDGKYAFNLWRPVTAIRNADQTSNPNTPREESWLPLGETPMHPEYPCAHCITSAAVATVLRSLNGGDNVELSLTSVTAPGVTRRWSSLQAYSDEVSSARIWAGFHYRFSAEIGKDMGRKIGELTMSTQLRGAEASAAPR